MQTRTGTSIDLVLVFSWPANQYSLCVPPFTVSWSLKLLGFWLWACVGFQGYMSLQLVNHCWFRLNSKQVIIYVLGIPASRNLQPSFSEGIKLRDICDFQEAVATLKNYVLETFCFYELKGSIINVYLKSRIRDIWKTINDSHVFVDEEWGTGLKNCVVKNCIKYCTYSLDQDRIGGVIGFRGVGLTHHHWPKGDLECRQQFSFLINLKSMFQLCSIFCSM